MNFISKIKALTRVQLMVSILFTIIFLATSAILYFERRNSLKIEVEDMVEKEITELSNIINIYLNRDRDILNLAVASAENKINELSDIVINTEKETDFEAVDPFTNMPLNVKIKEWKVDNSPIVGSYSIVDELNKLTKVEVSIYQKCDKGYVNISTSLKNLSEDRMTGDIIINSSPIVQTIEEGNQFTGRVHQRNSWYLASYKPIYIDGKVEGIYYLGIRERIGMALKEIFAARKYYITGYPFLINKQGIFLVHPDKQGEDMSSTNIFKLLISNNNEAGKISYKWPENEEGKTWELYYRYNPETEGFLCITYPQDEIDKNLVIFVLYITCSYLVFLILLQFLFYYSQSSIRDNLRKLRLTLNLLAKGHVPPKLDIKGEKEFVELSDKVNQIGIRLKEMAEFANGLANDNFTQKYPPTFIDDEIGEALIRINDKLNEAMYNEHIRLKEEKLRLWESEGLSKFVNILQRNRDNLQELCYEIILNLVQYLNANVGALFFINSDNPADLHFEQMATFAFDQKRFVEKKIYPEQGFIGRIYNEKQTIYLTEIPDGYINISSGLGESSPKNLLIVPLLINKEVYGAIEIASFNVIKGYQIEFIEKIGENIASTINNVLVNNKTRELLKQSRTQSELLSMQEEEMRRNLIELKNIQKESDAGMYEKRQIYQTIDKFLLLVELDGKGFIQSVNDQVPIFFRMEKTNLTGRHFSDYSYVIPVEEYKGLISKWELLKEGNKVQAEIKVKSGMGKMANVLTTLIPEFRDNQLVKVIIMGIEADSV
ncbi:MAG: Cache 3/Cache 2 fusion domain-containing protein [Bacteroidales bacterium]